MTPFPPLVAALQNATYSLSLDDACPLGVATLTLSLADDVGNARVVNITSVIVSTPVTIDLSNASVHAEPKGLADPSVRVHTGASFTVQVRARREWMPHALSAPTWCGVLCYAAR